MVNYGKVGDFRVAGTLTTLQSITLISGSTTVMTCVLHVTMAGR